MVTSTPDSWASLDRSEIDLSDILGTPAVDPWQVASDASAVGAFGPSAVAGEGGRGLLLTATRRPRPLLGRRPTRRARAAATRQARQVILDALGPEDLRPVHSLLSWTGTHEVFQQQVRGRDVVGGRVLVHSDDAGALALTGTPVGDLGQRDPGPRPRLTRTKARRAIEEQFAAVEGEALSVRAVVLPHDGGAEWAWFAKVPLRDPFADVHVFLADRDARPLLVYPVSVGSFFGEARVYPVSPTRTPDPVPVCLRELGNEPSGCLSGARVAITTDLGDSVVRDDRNFDFSVDDAEFDESSGYHLTSEALRYYAGLFRREFFKDPLFNPLRVVVHHRDSAANAFFHPKRKMITLGDWPAGPTASRSADIVLHEVGHAVTHAVARLADAPERERKGIGEGYSDYFACSALDDPKFGDYVTGKPEGARNCAKPGLRLQGPSSSADRYVLGEVWANVLWGIRERLGRTVADAVVAESLYFAATAGTVQDALGALREADAALFPTNEPARGRHWDVIGEEFAERLP
jgi:hypothetical protein